MLKNILIKCAELLNRNDIVKSLKSIDKIDSILDETLKSDVYRLINYFNFTSNTMFENYFDLTHSEQLSSNSSNIINYSSFSYTPVKILSVKDTNGNENVATVLSTHILTHKARATYTISYAYIPHELKNLTDELEFPERLSKIICYGVVSEFFACKNCYEQSEFWKNRFMYEIFKFKTRKERRVKSTFKLWVI